jgi:tetratricopeptide (TPR) repeat protein
MALELDDDSRHRWYPPALVQAAVGESKQYRASCRTVLDCFEKSDDREILNQVAWACAVAPEAVDDYERVVELTDRAVAGVDQPMHHLQNTRGAVLYRAGRHEEALRQFEAAVADHWKGGTAWDWFFLAMVNHKLGNRDDAQAWLDKAVDWMDEAPELRLSGADEDQTGPLFDWDQQLELEILRREAEALLTIHRA